MYYLFWFDEYHFTQDFIQEIEDTQKQLSNQNFTVKKLKVRFLKKFFLQNIMLYYAKINALKIIRFKFKKKKIHFHMIFIYILIFILIFILKE